MSKCLEKLNFIEKVFEKLADWSGYDLAKLDRDFETNFELDFVEIEKELKALEEHNEILNDYGLTLVDFREACLLLAMLKGENLNIHDIAKQLKALEIIKNKPVNTNWFTYYKDYEEYCEDTEYVNESKRLAKEEYDLLKEVML